MKQISNHEYQEFLKYKDKKKEQSRRSCRKSANADMQRG